MVTREEVFSPLPSKSLSTSSEFSFAGEEKTKLARKTAKNILKFALIYCSLRRNGTIIEVEKKYTSNYFVATVLLLSRPEFSHEPRYVGKPQLFHHALCVL
jgi:hypothetical protein